MILFVFLRCGWLSHKGNTWICVITILYLWAIIVEWTILNLIFFSFILYIFLYISSVCISVFKTALVVIKVAYIYLYLFPHFWVKNEGVAAYHKFYFFCLQMCTVVFLWSNLRISTIHIFGGSGGIRKCSTYCHLC